jgi:HEAT repeat protein
MAEGYLLVKEQRMLKAHERWAQQELTGSLLSELRARVDSLIAPLVPEHYYDRYGKLLASTLYELPVLEGLPETTLESGWVPLRLLNSSGVASPTWDAITQSPRVLITGPVGAGKSTLLRFVAWRLLTQPDEAFNQWWTYKLFKQSTAQLRPVLIDLRRLQDGDLLATVLSSLARFGFALPKESVVRRLEAGEIVLLCDHLEALQKQAQQAQLDEFLAKYPRTICVVTARCGTDVTGLVHFVPFSLSGLEAQGVETYARHALGEHSLAARGLLAACERSSSLAHLLDLPLMAASVCRSLRRRAVQRPSLSMLLEECQRVLLEEWPAMQGRPLSAAKQEVLACLARIAYELQCHDDGGITHSDLLACCQTALDGRAGGDAERMVHDLTHMIGVLQADGSEPLPDAERRYTFFSNLMQSYMVARWLVQTDQTSSLMNRVDDPVWHDTIALVAGLLPEPGSFLDLVERSSPPLPDKWFLLASCIAEVESGAEALQEHVAQQLFHLLEDDAQEALWPMAAAAIAGMTRRQSKDHFSAMIRDTDSVEARRRAALAMGRIGAPWAIPSLGAAITDEDLHIRQQAAWALGYIPSPQVVHVLSRALRSPHGAVRAAAAQALVRQAGSSERLEPVVADLINALDVERETPETVAAAERALVDIGATATPQLITALGSRRVRPAQSGRMARALGLLGDDRALPVLINAIRTEPPEQTEGYAEAIACIGEAAVAPLIHALEGRDITSGGGLVRALVKIGAPAVGPLLEAIAATTPEVRRAAVHALSDIGAPAIAPLSHAMLHDPRIEVRRRALEILAGRAPGIGEANVGATLIDALSDSDAGVQVHAVRYLGNLGYREAAASLIAMVQDQDEEQSLRREAINSLSAIGDPQAIAPLLGVLDEPLLREVASNALVDFGDRAVSALVETLHTTTDHERQSTLWTVLERIGKRGRPEDASPLGLARVYALLRSDAADIDRVLFLASQLDWWEHGRELHASLETAAKAAAVGNLHALGECGEAFAWLADIDGWLRPHVREILWKLRDIVEDTHLYFKSSRRDGQRDALLSAIDRLEEIREITRDRTLSFEQAVFEPVIDRWYDLLLETAKQLRGRALLLIRLLTPRLPVRDLKQRTTAVFSLFNEGDSSARNLTVSLRPVDMWSNGLRIVREEHNLDPLGIGEERHVEIPLIPGSAHHADLLFVARYDDDDRTQSTERISCRIEFYSAPSAYATIERNPYIVGMPVRESQMFFGRQDLFEWVRDNVSGAYQEQPLLLYGERRMGKTSLLYQLQINPPTPQHICLLFDLQLFAYVLTVNELLFELAETISRRLAHYDIDVAIPEEAAFRANAHRAFLGYADHLDEHLGDRRIVIMMDEFGVLMDKVRNKVFDASIFDYLRGLTQRSRKFTFLFTGAYEVRRMQKDFSSILFNMPKVRKISYLTDGDANALIVEPVRGLIEYHPLVIQRIRNVTACHPYFIQYICQELVRLAQREQSNYVELSDVDAVVQEVVRDATGNIENSIYNDLTDDEKLVLAALAHVTDEVRVFVLPGDIANMLERRRLGMSRESILESLRTLGERDLVIETRIGQQLRYSFRMGLVRMWLRENEMLLRFAQQKEGEA